jgi:signal peptidase I
MNKFIQKITIKWGAFLMVCILGFVNVNSIWANLRGVNSELRSFFVGQFIKVGDINKVPSGARWRGKGMAEVENGSGQYIEVGDINKVPSGTRWRGKGWAEVEKNGGEYIYVGDINKVPTGARWRGKGWAEVEKK